MTRRPAPKPQPGFQGKGGAHRHPRRADAGGRPAVEGAIDLFSDEVRADTGSGLLRRARTNDGSGIIEPEIHLAKRLKLFRQTEPPLTGGMGLGSAEIYTGSDFGALFEIHCRGKMPPSMRSRDNSVHSFKVTTFVECWNEDTRGTARFRGRCDI